MVRYTLSLLILLAACSPSDDRADKVAAQDTAASGKFTPPTPSPVATVQVDPIDTEAPGAILPPATQQYRYIGAWAPNPAACRGGEWRFLTRSLKTAGGIACDLPDVAASPTGFTLAGQCKAEGRKVAETIVLGFDEGRRTMRLHSQTLFPTVDLIYCGA